MEMTTKSFVVVHGDLCFLFVPDLEAGGYSVKALNRQGVNTQGDTFEEALSMGIEAAGFMAECEAEDRKTAKRPARSATKAVPSRRRPLATGGK